MQLEPQSYSNCVKCKAKKCGSHLTRDRSNKLEYLEFRTSLESDDLQLSYNGPPGERTRAGTETNG